MKTMTLRKEFIDVLAVHKGVECNQIIFDGYADAVGSNFDS
jgi:hypothetical protein